VLKHRSGSSRCALSGLPLRSPDRRQADERGNVLWMLDADQNLLATHPAQTLVADKTATAVNLEPRRRRQYPLCALPARETSPCGTRFFRPLRQVVESVNNIL
jgi:hypothetical protein